MTYGVEPSPGIDYTKRQAPPSPPTAPAAGPYGQPAPAPQDQHLPVGHGHQAYAPYGQPQPQPYGQQPIAPAPTGDVEIRPSRDQYRSFLAKTPIAFVVLIVLLYIREGVGGVLVGLVAGALALGGVLLYINVARVRMDALGVTRRGLVGTKTFARADLAQVILTPYQATTADPRVVLTLVALDRQGKRVLRLGSAIWNPADLEGLAHAMGPAPVVHTDVLNPKTLGERHPGSVSWAERHPYILGAIIAVALVAVVSVLVIALSS